MRSIQACHAPCHAPSQAPPGCLELAGLLMGWLAHVHLARPLEGRQLQATRETAGLALPLVAALLPQLPVLGRPSAPLAALQFCYWAVTHTSAKQRVRGWAWQMVGVAECERVDVAEGEMVGMTCADREKEQSPLPPSLPPRSPLLPRRCAVLESSFTSRQQL